MVTIVPGGPREFRSVSAMGVYIEAQAMPIISDYPCRDCGGDKYQGYSRCPKCATKHRRVQNRLRKRRHDKKKNIAKGTI